MIGCPAKDRKCQLRSVPVKRSPLSAALAVFCAQQTTQPMLRTTRMQIEPVPPALLSALSSEDELLEEATWLGEMICCWLNEEWAAQELLEVHAQLGEATGQVSRCCQLRASATVCCCARRGGHVYGKYCLPATCAPSWPRKPMRAPLLFVLSPGVRAAAAAGRRE